MAQDSLSFEPETTRELAIYMKGRFDSQEALSASDRADLAKHLGMDEERFAQILGAMATARETAILEHDKTRDLIMARDAIAAEDRATLMKHVVSCEAENKRNAETRASLLWVAQRALDIGGKLLLFLLTAYLGVKEGAHLLGGGG